MPLPWFPRHIRLPVAFANKASIGGNPAIAGIRIPISRIIYLLSQGYTVEAIHADYPWVAKEVLKGVIDEIVQLINTSLDVTKVSQVQTAA